MCLISHYRRRVILPSQHDRAKLAPLQDILNHLHIQHQCIWRQLLCCSHKTDLHTLRLHTIVKILVMIIIVFAGTFSQRGAIIIVRTLQYTSPTTISDSSGPPMILNVSAIMITLDILTLALPAFEHGKTKTFRAAQG